MQPRAELWGRQRSGEGDLGSQLGKQEEHGHQEQRACLEGMLPRVGYHRQGLKVPTGDKDVIVEPGQSGFSWVIGAEIRPLWTSQELIWEVEEWLQLEHRALDREVTESGPEEAKKGWIQSCDGRLCQRLGGRDTAPHHRWWQEGKSHSGRPRVTG